MKYHKSKTKLEAEGNEFFSMFFKCRFKPRDVFAAGHWAQEL
jgi:hypothetical protein